MRLLLACGCLLVLAGCSLVGPSDPFDDPYLDVYDVTFDWVAGTPPVTGRLSLTRIPSDVVYPDDPCAGAGGGLSGRWELDDPSDRFPDGQGGLTGGYGCDGLHLYLFDQETASDLTDAGVLYLLEGDAVENRQIEGTWDRIGSYPAGTFTARLVRTATERVIVP